MIKKTKKVKRLMPSLREKKRYLKIKIISLTGSFTTSPFQELLVKINNFFGIFESANAGIMLISTNIKENTVTLKVNNKYLDKLRASLLFIQELTTNKVIIKSIRASGSINKVK